MRSYIGQLLLIIPAFTWLLSWPTSSAAQQGPSVGAPGSSLDDRAALRRFTRVYKGTEADAVRTPVEKIAGKLDLILPRLREKLSPADMALLLNYASVDSAYLADLRTNLRSRQSAICEAIETRSDTELVADMSRVTREAEEQRDIYYDGLLRGLSIEGRIELIAAADKAFGGGTLVRVDGDAYAAAAPTAAAANIRGSCRRRTAPPMPLPGNQSDTNAPLQTIIR